MTDPLIGMSERTAVSSGAQSGIPAGSGPDTAAPLLLPRPAARLACRGAARTVIPRRYAPHRDMPGLCVPHRKDGVRPGRPQRFGQGSCAPASRPAPSCRGRSLLGEDPVHRLGAGGDNWPDLVAIDRLSNIR